MQKRYCISKQGFTLIELLVVISIIGLLSSVVFASLNTTRIKARDAKRKADLHSLETAIQLYYEDKGTFPDTANTITGDWPSGYKVQLAPYIIPPLDPLLPNTLNNYYSSYRVTDSTSPCFGQYALLTYIEGNNTGANTCGYGGRHYFLLLGAY